MGCYPVLCSCAPVLALPPPVQTGSPAPQTEDAQAGCLLAPVFQSLWRRGGPLMPGSGWSWQGGTLTRGGQSLAQQRSVLLQGQEGWEEINSSHGCKVGLRTHCRL